MNYVPKVRFEGFSDNWEEKSVEELFDKIKNPVDVDKNKEYIQIGIRSHGKGIFYKETIKGEELGNKRVFWLEPNVFIVNIVFAWERAVARTTNNEVGMIASHRFPMYKPKSQFLNLDFITTFFITKKGQYLLELASPGGAGRNKTLGQKEFDSMKVRIPSVKEQEKIASFLRKIDKLIEKQDEKVSNLELYKKGIMQKIFSQKIRFKKDNGGAYPEWEDKKIKDIFIITRGQVIAKTSISEDKKGEFLYPVYSSQTSNNGILGYDKRYDFEGNYLTWTTDGANAGRVFKRDGKFRCTNVCGLLVESELTKGFANNCIKEILDKATPKHVSYVGNPKLMNGVMGDIEISIPCIAEQIKISNLFSKIDAVVDKEKEKLEELRRWKKGLLQGMFV